MQFQGKCMIQIQENDEKTHFGPDLSPFRPNLGHNFFLKKINFQLSSSTITERTNDPILRKVSDGRMDR